MGGVLSNSAVGTALLFALARLVIWLLRLLPGSLPLFPGLLILLLLARRVALPALLRLGLVVLIGHLNLLKMAMKHNLNVNHSNYQLDVIPKGKKARPSAAGMRMPTRTTHQLACSSAI